MNILTIDTVLNKTYLSFLINEKEIFKTVESDENNYHSAYLVKVLNTVLEENNVSLLDFNYIGTNTGVGSFTGIRVGLSVVKILSNAANLPVVPLNTIEILAEAYNNKNILIDARRKSAFYSDDGLKTELITYDQAEKILKGTSNNFICDDSFIKNFPQYKERLLSYETNGIDLSATELKLTKNKIEKGLFVSSDKLKPTYIQTPPIFSKN